MTASTWPSTWASSDTSHLSYCKLFNVMDRCETLRLAYSPDLFVTKETPPTFLLQAEDDNVDGVNQSLVYYIALKNAWVPVEMHLYARGGYAFGLQRTQFPITDWPQLVEAWLGTIGMISE